MYQFSLQLAEDIALDSHVVLPTDPRFDSCLKEWKRPSYFGFDIETWASNGSALDPWRGDIRLVSIGLPSGLSIVVDFGGITGQDKQAGIGSRRTDFIAILKERLENPKSQVVGANLKFDFLWVLKHWGIKARNPRDVMLMSQVYWAGLNHFRHNLKAIAERLEISVDKTEQTSDFGAELSNAQLNYSANDSIVVIEIWKKLGKLLHKEKLSGSALAEMSALAGFVQMEYHGIPADWGKIRDCLSRYQEAAKTFLATWETEFPGINPDSSKQVVSAIADKYGIFVEGTSQSDLAPYYDKPAIKALSLLRTMGTYLDYLKGCESAYFDGAIRGCYRQSAPKGFGRSTCGENTKRNPNQFPNVNLQNPPNPLMMPPEIKALGLPPIRSLFVVPDDKALIISDLSSAHARIACEVSQDAALKSVYNDGADMHCLTASKLAKLQGLDWTPSDVAKIRGDKSHPQQPLAAKLRQAAKPTFYGSLNKQGAATLASTAKTDADIDMTIEEAKAALQAWKEAYAGLAEFMDKAVKEANRKSIRFPGSQFEYGENRGLSGRRIFMPKMKSDFKPDAPPSVKASDCCAFVWTSTEADIIKLAIGRCVSEFDKHPEWEAYIANCAHDELDVVCSREHALEVSKCVNLSMSAAMRVFIKSIPVDEGEDPKKIYLSVLEREIILGGFNMPVVKKGDRVTLSRTPLYSQILAWGDDRRISVFSLETVFDVLSVNGSKVELRAINQSERRSFPWFKNAVSKVLPPDPTAEDITEEEESHIALEDDDPARPCPSADISHMDLAELESVAEEKEVRRVPTSIGIHANGAISVEYEEEEVPAAPPAPTGTLLQFPNTGEEFETAISHYKGLRYWIAGKRENGKKPAEMHYFIEHNGKVTQSELHYCGVVFANRWAREAIDRLVALQEVV